ncbi:26S protease regulatory subunit 6A-like protein A [Hordeum vulgare]|nr:26S protease regulatory subunit 6A-like protein A [Hordeum vulgare]
MQDLSWRPPGRRNPGGLHHEKNELPLGRDCHLLAVRVIAATNRADILDPALLRSGRLDRKIEFPHPTEEARARILQIHSRKMNVHPDVNFEELARSTDNFNGAQLKAVCVEAGMPALQRDATEVCADSCSLETLVSLWKYQFVGRQWKMITADEVD